MNVDITACAYNKSASPNKGNPSYLSQTQAVHSGQLST